MATEDLLKTDLRLFFSATGEVDLDASRSDLELISGRDNLAQALAVRILTDKGELTPLGHPLYGSEVRAIIGRRFTEATRQLLRRLVIKALESDPRVSTVDSVVVRPHERLPDVAEVECEITSIAGDQVGVEVNLDVQ
jgi:phage baseplate assembly protein W